MNRETSYKKTAVIISGILIAMIFACLGFILFPDSSTENYIADIYQNGKLIQSIPLAEIDSPQIFVMKGDNGCQNTIQVTAGGISIISADCPDKLCVKQGIITDSKLPITCLPNRLVIQLRKCGDSDSLITDDIISY